MAGPFDKSVIDSALAVFGLGENYGREELSSAYRRVALRCHPDKGGRQDLFDTVRDCYEALRDHALASGSWDASDVGAAYESAAAARAAQASAGYRGEGWRARGGARPASGAAFNVAEFNRLYEESRDKNLERDAGYSDWLSRAAAEFAEPAKPAVSPGAGAEAFNRAFDRLTPALTSETGAVILRPQYASAGGLAGALYDDEEEVGDYTTDVGGGLCGSDCRIAHGEQRLASGRWAREEVLVDRGTLGRVAAERSAELESLAPRSDDPRRPARPEGPLSFTRLAT